MMLKRSLLVLCGMVLALGLGLALSRAEAKSPPAAGKVAAEKAPAPDDVANEVTQGALRFKNPEGTYVECPLKHTAVSAEVSGFIARVKVTQTFVNSAPDKIEAVYVFPLPHQSAVDSMTMVVGDRKVVGLIKRRSVARQIYEQAIAAGQLAALLEQERPNIFTQSVGNIAPGQTVRIEITYVDVLAYDMGVYTFHFPMTIGHRYMPGSATLGKSGTGTHPDTDRVPDASRITPPRIPPGSRSGADISLALALDAGVPIQDLKSVNHQVDLKQTGKHTATCALAAGDTIPNKDFELKYRVIGEKPELAVLAHADSGRDGYFMLMVQPRDDDALRQAPPREIVFLVDASGSMSGQPEGQSKAIMRAFLERTKPADKFQVILFKNSETRLFDKAADCTPDNVQKAADFIKGYRSDGGTEMLKGVTEALDAPVDGNRVRVVIMLTDGGVGNENEIFKKIKERCGDQIRFWCLGVGSSVNRHLVDGVAKQGGGMAKVLSVTASANDVKSLVEEVVMRIHRAQLANIAINWGSLNVYETYPARVPELWAGRPVVVFGRYTGGGKARVRIAGEAEGQATSFDVAVELPKSEPQHDVLGPTWARQKIESLMESVAYADDCPEVIEEVTKIALEYKLMSQYTSFVAVDAESATAGDDPVAPPRRVTVPIPVPLGVDPGNFFGAPAQWAAGERAEGLALREAEMDAGFINAPAAMPAKPSASTAPGRMYKGLEAKDKAGAFGYREAGRASEGRSRRGYYAANAKIAAQTGSPGPGGGAAIGAVLAPPAPMEAPSRDRALMTVAAEELGKADGKKAYDREAAAAQSVGQHTYQALADESRKQAEADNKKAKELLEQAAKLVEKGQLAQARGVLQLAYLFDDARARMYLSDGSVASTAMAKLEELETKLSEAQLKAEPRLKTRLDLVLREKDLAEALAEVTKAARLKLDLAPGAVSDARRLAGSRLLHVTYLDLRRYTAAQALDALCGPACLDWSAEGARLTVTSARRGETPAPWTYDVATLAIPEPKELGEGKDYQKTTAAAGAAAAEFLAAARKAVGAKEDEDCFWLAPGQLVVFGDREVQARMTKFIAALEAGEGELGKKALARQTARKDLAAKAEEAIEKQEVYGVLQGASWRLLAAAAGGERDLEALAWLEHAWSRAFAKELAGAKTPLTALRSAWTASEAALALPKDKELGALAKTALAEADKSADAALAALDKEKENAGAYLATLYATMALRNGQELGLVKKARVKEFNAKALPLLTGKAAKSPLEPLRLAARTLLEQDAPDAKELAGLFKQRLYGDDLTALVALAARKAGTESWLAFRAEARERLRESGASGPVVLLASRLSKPLLPSAR